MERVRPKEATEDVEVHSVCSEDVYDTTDLDNMTYEVMFMLAKKEAMAEAQREADKKVQGLLISLINLIFHRGFDRIVPVTVLKLV